MSKVKMESYFVVQGFMVEELKLKGNELMIYAIIYGFSQAKGNRFTGSLQYLADWTRSTKQGVIKNLKSLLEKGYIEKEEYTRNGVKFVEYYTTKLNGVLNKVEQGYSTQFNGGIQQSLPNNIVDNTEDNINRKNSKERVEKESEFVPPTLQEVIEYAKQRNSTVDPVKFYDYFSEGHWIDSEGKQVNSWKQKFITWEGRGKDGRKQHPANAQNSTATVSKWNIHYDN
jgi:DNA-binding MarR family transcriptional regulator